MNPAIRRPDLRSILDCGMLRALGHAGTQMRSMNMSERRNFIEDLPRDVGDKDQDRAMDVLREAASELEAYEAVERARTSARVATTGASNG